MGYWKASSGIYSGYYLNRNLAFSDMHWNEYHYIRCLANDGCYNRNNAFNSPMAYWTGGSPYRLNTSPYDHFNLSPTYRGANVNDHLVVRVHVPGYNNNNNGDNNNNVNGYDGSPRFIVWWMSF